MSSNRPELGGIVLALQSTALSEDALLLCDNEAVLKVINQMPISYEKLSA